MANGSMADTEPFRIASLGSTGDLVLTQAETGLEATQPHLRPQALSQGVQNTSQERAVHCKASCARALCVWDCTVFSSSAICWCCACATHSAVCLLDKIQLTVAVLCAGGLQPRSRLRHGLPPQRQVGENSRSRGTSRPPDGLTGSAPDSRQGNWAAPSKQQHNADSSILRQLSQNLSAPPEDGANAGGHSGVSCAVALVPLPYGVKCIAHCRND